MNPVSVTKPDLKKSPRLSGLCHSTAAQHPTPTKRWAGNRLVGRLGGGRMSYAWVRSLIPVRTSPRATSSAFSFLELPTFQAGDNHGTRDGLPHLVRRVNSQTVSAWSQRPPPPPVTRSIGYMRVSTRWEGWPRVGVESYTGNSFPLSGSQRERNSLGLYGRSFWLHSFDGEPLFPLRFCRILSCSESNTHSTDVIRVALPLLKYSLRYLLRYYRCGTNEC